MVGVSVMVVVWVIVGVRVMVSHRVFRNSGDTTDKKRGGMYRKRRKKAGYTVTEILVA